MNIVKVDAMGDNCPIPVIKTKKALDALTESAIVEVSVDNEIALQNVIKMANQKELSTTSETINENHFIIRIQYGDVESQEVQKEEILCKVDKEEKTAARITTAFKRRTGRVC